MIRADGGSAEALVLDVSQIEDASRRIAAAGPFHILVNNAGTNRPAAFQDVTPADFDTVMSLNVRAAFFVWIGMGQGPC